MRDPDSADFSNDLDEDHGFEDPREASDDSATERAITVTHRLVGV